MAALYPHMKAGESEIWERFLSRLPWEAVSISYDVRLGEGVALPEETPEWVKRMAYMLSAKRLDALVETRDRLVICEVKQRASFGAIGQLLGYRLLYLAQFEPSLPVHLVIVCELVAPDVAPVAREYGIVIYVV